MKLIERKLHHQKGFSLVEIIVVIFIIGVAGLLIGNLPSSISSTNRSQHESLAKDIANKQIETLRRTGYTNLSNGTTTISDTDLSKLPSYTAEYIISDCGAPYCTNGEDAKVITVTITWNEIGDTKQVQLATIVSSGGIGQ
jgi:prepilin-type N-terminal cleavage/methylation domain-containing protein